MAVPSPENFRTPIAKQQSRSLSPEQTCAFVSESLARTEMLLGISTQWLLKVCEVIEQAQSPETGIHF